MAFSLPAPGFRTKERHQVHGQSQDQVLERVRRGDPGAVALLYDDHHEAVRAFAARLLGDDTAAEDMVHEVFVVLPKALQRFRGDSSIRSFILGIAANRSKHHIRKACRRRVIHERLARTPARESGDPETNYGRRELALLLQRALDSLPADQRVTFVLCEVEERTSADVAEIVGVPAATVRTRLFHARRKLQNTPCLLLHA